MPFKLPPPPTSNDPSSPAFRDWFFKLKDFLGQALDLTNVSGVLGIGNGGTGNSDTPENGELLIGNGTDFDLATLTAGDNITITNGSGTITIAATGGDSAFNIEGGYSQTIYLGVQNVDGGSSASTSNNGYDGGNA